jgi:hypothetical protein
MANRLIKKATDALLEEIISVSKPDQFLKKSLIFNSAILKILSVDFYPVRKPQPLCWGWWKYLQKQEHQLLIKGGVKALLFQTKFTLLDR